MAAALYTRYPEPTLTNVCLRVDRLLHFGLWYRKQKPVWHQGRVVMLGDAAHATLPYMGQGYVDPSISLILTAPG